MAYQSLSSEKYLLESLQNEVQAQQAERRRLQRKAFAVNSSAIIVVTAGVYGSITTMPTWLPFIFQVVLNWGLV